MTDLSSHFLDRLARRCREEADRLHEFARRNTTTLTNEQGFTGTVRTAEAVMAERAAADLESLAAVAEGREP